MSDRLHGYGDDGNLVPIAPFDFPDDTPADYDDCAMRRDVVTGFLRRLLTAGDPRAVGRLALLVAAALRLRTQREVADLLGISEPAVSRGVKQIRRQILTNPDDFWQ